MEYFNALKLSMENLAKNPRVIFLGQSTKKPGVAMYNTLTGVPEDKKIEMPVAENMQLGMSIGLALQGYIPVSIFPRWNFLLSATDQLVNHLDKLEEMSHGDFKPKVIIRVGVGSTDPLYPGAQHVGDFSWGIQQLLGNVEIRILKTSEDVIKEYKDAMNSSISTILVEYMENY